MTNKKSCVQRVSRFFGLCVLLCAGHAWSAATDGALRVELVTTYNLTVDSNAGSPSSYAPRAAYLGATFHNDGSVPLTDVIACIGDYKGGAGDTPGLYPSRVHDGLTGPLDGGAFALTHEGGSAGVSDATRYIASIPAGGSVTVYWLISYPQLDVNGIPTWGLSVKPDDDLWLQYDVWARANEGATARAVDLTRTLTMRNEISASSNLVLPNTANKVPTYYRDLLSQYVPAWTNISMDGTVGSRIVSQGVWYDLGIVGAGFDNDGDLVPDRNAWLQPVGDPSLFDASGFRLIHTYAMVIVKLKSGGEQILYGEDQLYFENIPENNGAVGYVRYEFMPLLAGARSVTTPYQEVASGNDNEKFNADYGVSLGGPLVSYESRVLVDKAASVASVAAGGTIAYTVGFTNAGAVVVGDPTEGVPLVIQDQVPAGTAYVAGSATAGNTLPAGVSSYHVLYSSDGGVTWSLAEPSPASAVTHIQWWLDDPLPGAAAGAVGFSVTVASPYTLADPWINNVAGLSFGNGAPFAHAHATTRLLGNNSLGDTVFADTGVGAGGFFANTLQDGTEPGLAGIPVDLYFDTDGDGTLDAGEPLVGTTSTDANGHYAFSGLMDGRFLVVVDATSSHLPLGYTATTAETVAVALDPLKLSATGVADQTADFGFAPALMLDKGRVGSGNLREGQQVTYLLTVTNRLPGSGTMAPQPARYTVWATNGVTGTGGKKSWTNTPAAWHPVEPDQQYAVAPYKDNSENIVINSFGYGPQPGAITNVTLLLPIVINGVFETKNGSTLELLLFTNSVQIGATRIFKCSTLTNGTLAVDITAYKASWAWADFNGSLLSVELIAKALGAPAATVGLDAVGFRVTTDRMQGGLNTSTTLDPVPLVDAYDPARLRYLSASTRPDSVVTNGGSGTLTWENIGPIYASGGYAVSVTFEILQPPGNSTTPVTNAVAITNAFFMNGRAASPVTDLDVATVLPAGTIGDYVWRDLDGDTVQDANEPGVANVTVRLTPPAGVDLGAGTNQPVTTVTDSKGYYLFKALPASGNYTVSVVTTSLPGGTGSPTFDRDGIGSLNTAVVGLVYDSTNGADTVSDADFGYHLQSTIRGTLWHDLDRDGLSEPESGEDMLSAVTVRLYAADGVTLLATTNTSASGAYQFTGAFITNGTYVVKADAATGALSTGTWTRSYDSDGTGSANQVTLSIAAGGLGIGDFSYCRAGTLSVGDVLFYDVNANGVQEPEDDGINHVNVYLYQDENGNGFIDAADAYIATALTATNGSYRFDNLAPGTYQVIVDQTDPSFPQLHMHTYDPYGPMDGISVVTLTTTNNLAQDFGYIPYGFGSIGDTVWYDSNADGVRLGNMEVGISNVLVTLDADLDGDGQYHTLRTTYTDAEGKYLFENLPVGDYVVRVSTNSAALPIDAFGDPCRLTTAATYPMSVTYAETNRDADFGFVLPGAIGDTVYWDLNGNGDQDWNSPGIPGVTVNLYRDANTNGVYDGGEAWVASEVTDAGGKYIFDNLMPGRYVVVVDGASAPIANATLTADPSNDGEPCPIPAVAGPACDGQYGVLVIEESTYRGADFGYRPLGCVGDLLWLDLNTNGLFDAGERGIPYVTVELYSGATLVASEVTDADGYYGFGNVADGTYRVVVVTNGVDFPAGLAATYDADGTADSAANEVVLSSGHVTSIGGRAVTAAEMTLDFGYVYAGVNRLSGTVGLDAPVYDGVLNGSAPSGVAADEYAFAGAGVYLYLWRDADSNNLVNTGESVLIASTFSSADGDYSFSNLPQGGEGDRYIVSLAAPADGLKLTTETGDTTALWVSNTTNLFGITKSAYQVVAIAESRDNIDFAFQTTVLRDYGDLPVSYSTTIADRPEGASHTLVAGADLWLGSGVTAEANGQPTADATGDTGDDGVVAVGSWHDGATGGVVRVTVGAGSGWLAGWIDFNQDGAFTNMNEQVIGQAVSATESGGVYQFAFDIPGGTFGTNGPTVLNARFRLYPEPPPAALFSGTATGGEVEDHQFVFGLIGNRVWEDMNGNGCQDMGEPGVSNVTVRLYDAGALLVDSAVTAGDGSYAFTGLPTNSSYSVVVTKPEGTVFTTPLAGGDAQQDSNADASGSCGSVSLSPAADRRDIDAGLYRPASVSGYVFKDSNATLVRDAGDGSITNILVRLVVGGVTVASTNTDSAGYYHFENVAAGAVTVLVSSAEATLVGVPTQEPAASNPHRNRAKDKDMDKVKEADAFIEYSLTSGQASETLNFGFATYPLSTAIDFKASADGRGGVVIELWTVNESGYDDIVVYAWLANAWVEVGRVPSGQVVGYGSNAYTIRSSVLPAGGPYYFRIVDEAGHVHDSPVPVSVAVITVSAIRFDMQTAVLTFTTEYGVRYEVRVSDSLSADSGAWSTEYVSVLRDGVWSAYSNRPFMAGQGAQTQVRVPVNRQKAFFKIVRADP